MLPRISLIWPNTVSPTYKRPPICLLRLIFLGCISEIDVNLMWHHWFVYTLLSEEIELAYYNFRQSSDH